MTDAAYLRDWKRTHRPKVNASVHRTLKRKTVYVGIVELCPICGHRGYRNRVLATTLSNGYQRVVSEFISHRVWIGSHPVRSACYLPVRQREVVL